MTFLFSESVFLCDIHPKYPDPPLVATGGEDDRALVWNAKSGEILLEGQGFKDSVTQV